MGQSYDPSELIKLTGLAWVGMANLLKLWASPNSIMSVMPLPERAQRSHEQGTPRAEVRHRSLSRQYATALESKHQSPTARDLYGDSRDVLNLDTTSTTRRIRPHAAVRTRSLSSSDGLAMFELRDVQQPQ